MIDRETMQNLQDLSMLRLGEEEERELASQLENILEYFSLLSNYDTSEVDPDLGATVIPGQLRIDASRDGVSHHQIEKFAVEFEKGHFVVPRILGDGTDA